MMDRISATKRNLIWMTLYAIAMAQVEASLVIHLRTIYHPGNPQELFPLSPFAPRDLSIELLRELATLVMILSVALLAARGFTKVFAAFVYVFGLWDIFYYVWLKVMIAWPVAWLEWDVLFLIPWPWFGPWITPVLIALLFIIWGGRTYCSTEAARFNPATFILFSIGALLALAAFLLPAVPLLKQGVEAMRHFQPGNFCWGLFIPGYVLMAFSLWRVSVK